MKDKIRLYNYYLSRNPFAYDKYAVLDFGKIYPQFESYFSPFLAKDRQAKILDLGCGSGAFVSWLHTKGYENAEGIDVSREQIHTRTKRGVKSLECADAFEYLKDLKGKFSAVAPKALGPRFLARIIIIP